jgi:hypothetical protein
VQATREPLTLTWVWPGLTGPRSRRPVNIPETVARALAEVGKQLLPTTSPGIRDALLLSALLKGLREGQRERLYAEGALLGPTWEPSADPYFNRLLRGWVFSERLERTQNAREAGGIVVKPIEPTSRRVREVVVPVSSSVATEPFDADASWAAIQRALDRLDEAGSVFDEVNARVSAALTKKFGS